MIDLKKLSEPFPPEDIEWFIGVTTKNKDKGLAIPFITARAVQNRLDEVVGLNKWKNRFFEWKTGAQLCEILIYDDEMNEWIGKIDGSGDTDIEGVKGGLSASFKRSATMWGIGRYLYSLDNVWVPIEPKGNSYEMSPAVQIILPAWALPGGTGKPDGQNRKPWVQYINSNTAPQQNNNSNQTEQPQQNNSTTAAEQQNNSSQGAQQPQSGGFKLSAKQIDRAYKKAAAAKLTQDDVILWITKKFGISEVALLNRAQYDELCAKMDEYKMKGEQ